MNRHILSIVVIALMTAAVGAQAPKALSSAQKGELFKKNREVIELVIDKTVESSKSPNDPLKRANSYYEVLLHFSKQISTANSAQDSRRVEELAQHLKTLLDDGLKHTLEKAKAQVEGGTGVEEFRKLRVDLLNQLNALLGVLSADPAAKASLDDARARLNGITIPEK